MVVHSAVFCYAAVDVAVVFAAFDLLDAVVVIDGVAVAGFVM